MTTATSERSALRDLAKRYADVCRRPEQDERRTLWRRLNSLQPVRPLIYTRAFAWHEMPESHCTCADPVLRHAENFLRCQLFWDSLNDDSIFEPWITAPTVYRHEGWGMDRLRIRPEEERGAYKDDYPIRALEDVAKMQEPRHDVDGAATARNAERLGELFGDLLAINVDRAPAYRTWRSDLSTDLGHLRGIEHVMLDMVDNPEWLHRLVGFMGAGVLRVHEQAEAAGDWNLSAHYNQAMPYALELPDPAANVHGVPRRKLWIFVAAQEFTAVSPAMHEEFLLRYQLPIVREFGLCAYGCCEDLTNKIDMLRQIPNLRRIAVSPFANVARCAEQIGADYVMSYRPSPADMVSYGFDETRILGLLRRDLARCRGGRIDVTLKDVETVGGDPERVRRWVALARRAIDEVWN